MRRRDVAAPAATVTASAGTRIIAVPAAPTGPTSRCQMDSVLRTALIAPSCPGASDGDNPAQPSASATLLHVWMAGHVLRAGRLLCRKY